MTAERDESKENRDAVTSVPFRYARYTLSSYTPLRGAERSEGMSVASDGTKRGHE